MINTKTLTIIVLFSLGALHAVIFGFLEYPSNFLTVNLSPDLQKTQTVTLYSVALITACFSYAFSKSWGLKRVLILGLFFYLLGMVLFSLSGFFKGDTVTLWLVFLAATALFGAAFSSVVVALTTYIILELPKHIGIGVTVLFAFMNMGAMLSPILLNFFTGWEMGWVLTVFMAILIFGAMWGVSALFFDLPIPKHLENMRRGSLIWKEMHYRFALFILAIILYGVIENTFNLWGEEHLLNWLPPRLANETISIFWLFLVIGQLVVLLPLHYFKLSRVFYFLVIFMIASLVMVPLQEHLSGFIAFLALGGAGCSACFPILLAMLEMEIKEITKKLPEEKRVPFLEIGVALMFAGYIGGVGIVGTRVSFLTIIGVSDLQISHNFYFAAILGFILLCLTIFLSKSFYKKVTSEF